MNDGCLDILGFNNDQAQVTQYKNQNASLFVLYIYLGISVSSEMVYVNFGWENGKNLKQKQLRLHLHYYITQRK